MIKIKNFTIFKCDIRENFHWSKLPKLKKLMDKNRCILKCADLERANLQYVPIEFADLRCADLQYANLQYAGLRYADLRGTDFRHANLQFADLQNVFLQCADLRYADFRGANLIGANLQCADLRNANLKRANLQHADLSGADLSGAELEPLHYEEVIVEDFMYVRGLGSCNRLTLIFKTDIGIVIQCGCFYGTEKEFRKQVKLIHGTNNYAKEYLEMIKLAKIRFNRED